MSRKIIRKRKPIADGTKAVSLKPTCVNAYINRGLAYYDQGNYQQAIARTLGYWKFQIVER